MQHRDHDSKVKVVALCSHLITFLKTSHCSFLDIPEISFGKQTRNYRRISLIASGEHKKLQFLSIAELVLAIATENRTLLLRDVYYYLKPLFSNQQECNIRILDLGKILQLSRCKDFTYALIWISPLI
jgi:DNA topoisomerase VI subunit A